MQTRPSGLCSPPTDHNHNPCPSPEFRSFVFETTWFAARGLVFFTIFHSKNSGKCDFSQADFLLFNLFRERKPALTMDSTKEKHVGTIIFASNPLKCYLLRISSRAKDALKHCWMISESTTKEPNAHSPPAIIFFSFLYTHVGISALAPTL